MVEGIKPMMGSRARLPGRVAIVLVAVVSILSGMPVRGEIPKAKRAQIEALRERLKGAGKLFSDAKPHAAAKELEAAQQQLIELATGADQELLAALAEPLSSLQRAHVLMDLEGIDLTELPDLKALANSSKSSGVEEKRKAREEAKRKKAEERKKRREKSAMAKGTKPEAMDGAAGGEGAPEPRGDGVSFARDVAPVLAQNCGGCHIAEAKGKFQMVSFSSLMAGVPGAGVVIFPSDPVGSRLIEVIESGAMPPSGGGIPAAELALLKQWIVEGAKYDGKDPEQPLPALIASASNGSTPERDPKSDPNPPMPSGAIDFARDIAPLLVDGCAGCHLEVRNARGQFNMETFDRLMAGGVSGTAVVAGKSGGSNLIRKLRGQMGQRMPAGRPPLPDAQIDLIARWIDQGAQVKPEARTLPLRRLSSLAWVKGATHQALSAKRLELAVKNWQLGLPDASPAQLESDNFVVMAELPADEMEQTMALVEAAGKQATAAIKLAEPKGTPKWKGRVAVHVFKGRYEYSEFGKMIEQRTLPNEWYEHWRFDGIDAYVALVANEEEAPEALQARLARLLLSVRVAQVSDEVPRWISEGVGRAFAAKLGGRNGPGKLWDAELPVAMRALEKPEMLLTNGLPPDQADVIGYAIGRFLMDNENRKTLEAILKLMATGATLEQAMLQSVGVKPEQMIMEVKRRAVAG
jgi:hypothetical protein